MTTRQAALLAAAGTALQIVTPPISTVSALVTLGASFRANAVLNVLVTLLSGVIFLGPILVFFVCVYWDEPLLAIPRSLRRPALVAAVAAGLSAAYTAIDRIQNLISTWDLAHMSSMRADHPFYWAWQWPLDTLIWILALIGVSLFFFAVARSAAAPQGVSPRLKKAAKYAGIVAIVGAILTTFGLSLQIFYSTHSTLGARRWFAIPHIALSWFYSGSLAWFFYRFYKTMPMAQSSQRLSSGE